MNGRPAALVVGGWGLVNLGLALGLVVSGGYWEEFGVYLVGVLIAFVLCGVAFAAWLRGHRQPSRFSLPGHPLGSLLAAGAALCAGLGLIYGWWFGLLAIPLLAGALPEVVRGRRK